MGVIRRNGYLLRPEVTAFLFLCGAALSSAQSFPNSGTITVNNGSPAAATPYPTSCPNASCITVPPLSGSFVSMTVSINYSTVSAQSISDPAVLLVSPSGQALDILSFTCAFDTIPPSLSLTLSDTAGTTVPHGTCPTLSSSYKPTSYGGSGDAFPSFGGSYVAAGDGSTSGTGTSGTGTLAGTFGSGTFNGTWKLYVADQTGAGSPTVISSWSLNITFSGAAVSTTTALTAGSPNPSFTSGGGSSVTFTATVTSGGSPVTTGTVTLHDATTNTDLGSGVALNGSGQAVLTGVFSPEGIHQVNAVYNGNASFATSTSSNVSQTANNHATQTGNTICNNGAITLNNGNPSIGTAASPYPSSIIMGTPEPNLTGIIQKVTVTLNGFTYGDEEGLGFVLSGPNGKNFEFMSDTGGSSPPASAVNLTFDDNASNPLTFGTNPSAGTYKPTSDVCNPSCSSPPDPYQSPAPGSFDSAAPFGSATLLQEFGGASPNTTWTLYAANRANTGTPGTVGSWCLNFTMQTNAHGTTTTVSGSPNPATTGTSPQIVTITASVTSDVTVTAGTVTFTDGTTTLGSTSVSNNTASITTSTLTEGTHHIVASYGGTSSGTIFGVSSNNYNQRIDHTTAPSGTYTYCNGGALTIPGGTESLGPDGPYPSNIFVTALPGTVQALTVKLKSVTSRNVDFLNSLLVGPTGTNLDFFSRSGPAGAISALDLTFDDTASSGIPSNLSLSGSYKPTSGATGNSYPACPPNATNCTSPPVGPPLSSNPFTPSNYAQPAGNKILGNTSTAGVFGGTTGSTFNGNGTWSLFQQLDTEDASDGSIGGGWCLNFTQNAPVFTLNKAHTGNFTQGQQGVLFTITAHNSGPGPSGGVATVTDAMPTGLTPTGAGAGTDPSWSCNVSTQTVTCTNSTAVAAGSDYPTLTLAANVTNTATSPLMNQASISGGGLAASVSSNVNSVTIVPAPDLIIIKARASALVQGQTVTYSIGVGNNISGSTTSGQVTVADTPPAGLTYDAAASTPNGWSCGVATGTVTCTITQAVTGGNNYPTITLAFDVAASASGTISNTATVSGGGELNTANDSSTATTTVVQTTTTAAGNASATFSATDQTVPLSATVTTAPGTVGTGSVTFTVKNGGTTIGSPVTSGTVTAGAASANYTLPGGTGIGTYTIQAVYTAGLGFTGSSDSSHTLTVSAPACTAEPDVTSSFSASPSGFHVNLANGHYLETVTLTNTSGSDIANLNFVLDNLTNATLSNPTGATSCTTPSGSPYVSMGAVPSGQTVYVKLDFIKTPGTIAYTMRLLGGTGTP